MAFTIREAQAHEADLLSQLALESKAYWGYSSDFIAACVPELSLSAAQMALNDHIFMLCEFNTEIIGFYVIKRLSEKNAELDALFVKPNYIGKGLGKKLMIDAIEQAKGMGCTSLVIQSDPNAAQFYLTMGATLIGKQASKSVSGRYLPVLNFEIGDIVNT